MENTYTQTLRELILPLTKALEVDLWGIECPGHPRGGVVRIYIDHPEGIKIEQCVQLTKQINYLLDVEDPIPGPYTLEVSSPGLERPFFSLDQLTPYLGKKVKIKLKQEIKGRKKCTGTLLAVQERSILLSLSTEELELPWDLIKKINLVYEG